MFSIIVLEERSHLFFQLKLITLGGGKKGSEDAACAAHLLTAEPTVAFRNEFFLQNSFLL